MIEKLYSSYDDNNYYIDTNRKKLAEDNAKIIGKMLTFFIAISAFSVLLEMAFGNGIKSYKYYIPAIIAIVILIAVNRIVAPKIKEKFEKVRIYALIIYSIVILSVSIADAVVFKDSRSLLFPIFMVLFSCMYIDYLTVVAAFRLILTIVFLVVDYKIKTGEFFRDDLTITALVIPTSIFAYNTIVHCMGGRREDNIMLVNKSQTDLLTGLLNKISFQEKCEEYLNSRVVGAKCTMFIFDLDNFKNVNDNYGHQTGDKVLKHFAEILRSYFHPDDVIGRIGGDEFMVLVLGEMPEEFADNRCRSIIHEIRTSKIDGIKGVTCSIGIAEDAQGKKFDELYKMADSALYKSKENGKATFDFERTV